MALHARSRATRLVLVLFTAVLPFLAAGCTDTTGATPSTGASSGPAIDRGTLLAPVRAFVDAVADKDADKVAAAFADNGVVIDVSRRIEGRDAVRRWAANETIIGTLTVLHIAETGADRQRLLVRFAPGGTGGFQAHYTFTIADDRISLLDMQYA